MPAKATVTLEVPDEAAHVITASSYSICKSDGRMLVDSNSFKELLSAAAFLQGDVVLVTFKECSDHSVSIIFQRIIKKVPLSF